MSHANTPLIPRHFFAKRHGPSVANAAYKAMYRGDFSHFTAEFLARPDKEHELTREGVERVMRAARYLQQHVLTRHMPRHVYVSTHRRAVETYKHLYLPSTIPHTLSDELIELSWGHMPTVHPQHWDDTFKEFYTAQESCSWSALRPGGESYRCVAENRLRPFLSRVTHAHQHDTVWAITHGNILETLHALCANMEPRVFHQWRAGREDVGESIANCDVHHYTHENPKTDQYDPSRIWYREIHAGRDTPRITTWARIR